MAKPECPGSGIVLDGPEGLTHLVCPNCAALVLIRRYETTIPRWIGAPMYKLRGHRYVELPRQNVAIIK